MASLASNGRRRAAAQERSPPAASSMAADVGGSEVAFAGTTKASSSSSKPRISRRRSAPSAPLSTAGRQSGLVQAVLEVSEVMGDTTSAEGTVPLDPKAFPPEQVAMGLELLGQERQQMLEWRDKAFKQVRAIEEENSQLQARQMRLQSELDRLRHRCIDLECLFREEKEQRASDKTGAEEAEAVLRTQLSAYSVEIDALREERDRLTSELTRAHDVVEELSLGLPPGSPLASIDFVQQLRSSSSFARVSQRRRRSSVLRSSRRSSLDASSVRALDHDASTSRDFLGLPPTPSSGSSAVAEEIDTTIRIDDHEGRTGTGCIERSLTFSCEEPEPPPPQGLPGAVTAVLGAKRKSPVIGQDQLLSSRQDSLASMTPGQHHELLECVRLLKQAFAQLQEEYVEQTRSFGLFVKSVSKQQHGAKREIDYARHQWKAFNQDLTQQSALTLERHPEFIDSPFKRKARSLSVPSLFDTGRPQAIQDELPPLGACASAEPAIQTWASLLNDAHRQIKAVKLEAETFRVRAIKAEEARGTQAVERCIEDIPTDPEEQDQDEKEDEELDAAQNPHVSEVIGAEPAASSTCNLPGKARRRLSRKVVMRARIFSQMPDPKRLKVHIIKAKELPTTNAHGTADSYCFCEVPGRFDSKHRTKVVRHTLNPEFNEVYEIDNYVGDEPLKFSIYDSQDVAARSGIIRTSMVGTPNAATLLGTAELESGSFFPSGCDVKLHLKGCGSAWLLVKVEVLPMLRSTVMSDSSTSRGAPRASVASVQVTYEKLLKENEELAARLLVHEPSGSSAKKPRSERTNQPRGQAQRGVSFQEDKRSEEGGEHYEPQALVQQEMSVQARKIQRCLKRFLSWNILHEFMEVEKGLVLEKVNDGNAKREPRFVALFAQEMELRWTKCAFPMSHSVNLEPKIRSDMRQKLTAEAQHHQRFTLRWTHASTADLQEVILIDYGVSNRACVLSEPREDPWLCFSLYTAKRSYDFVCPDQQCVMSWVLSLSRLVPFASGAIKTKGEFWSKSGWCKVQWYCHTHNMTPVQALLEAVRCSTAETTSRDPDRQRIAHETREAKMRKIAERQQKGRRSHYVEANSKKTRTSTDIRAFPQQHRAQSMLHF